MTQIANKSALPKETEALYHCLEFTDRLNLDQRTIQMARSQDPSTLCGIGDLYISQGFHGYQKAFQWYELATKQCYAEAEYRLGRCYMNGWGIAVNMDKALEMFKLSSNHFHPVSMYKVGFIYHYGLSAEGTDYKKARAWYVKASHYHVAKAQYNIGVIYEMGLGVPESLRIAMDWYEKSAALGFFLAKESLKRMGKKKGAFAFLKPKKAFNIQVDAIEELSGVSTQIDPDMPNTVKSSLLGTAPAIHTHMLSDDYEKGEGWILDEEGEFSGDRGYQSDRGISASDIDMKMMVDDMKKRNRNVFQRIF